MFFRGPIVSAHPEPPHLSDKLPDRTDSVTWINREHTPHGVPEPVGEPGSVVPAFIRKNPRRWTVVGVVLLLALVALTVARHYLKPGTPVAVLEQQSLPLVTAAAPGIQAVTSTVSFTGTIQARYDMSISPEGESGRITEVLVEAGDHVKRGQVLARLDDSVLRPQLTQLAASVEEAKAQAALSEAEARRARAVSGSGALSAEEIARREATAATDAARVKVAVAQLAQQEARLDKTEIRAPANGIVLTRTAEVGQTASPGGQALFRLARDGEVEMRGQVAERDLAALTVGQPAQVYITGLEKPFEGKVRLLGAIIDPNSRLGEIRIALKPHESLRPGAFARGEVTVGTAKRPVLPQTAVLTDSQGTYVLVVNDQNKAVRRAVQVGNTVPDGLVITDGLKGDERVVTTAGAFLRPGETVKVVEPRAEHT
jgi:RND family efflux transporter MFP subunit